MRAIGTSARAIRVHTFDEGMAGVWIGVVAFVLFGAAIVGTWLFWNEVRQSLPDRFEPTDRDAESN